VGNHPNLATTVIRALRPHHWTKNLLLAVPLVVAQEWHNLRAVGMVSLAALCFCLVASSGYLWNDIFDLALPFAFVLWRQAATCGMIYSIWPQTEGIP